MTPAAFAEALLTFCAASGGSVTSYLRTVAHNHAVGGVVGSPHTHAVGADVVYDAPMPVERRDALAASLGLHVIHEGDHDHLQPTGWVNQL